jgi:hypothetical protein
VAEARRYTPRGSTWDPCPACKVGDRLRPRDGICSDCRRVLDNAKLRAAEAAEKPSEEQRRLYFLQERAYALPYLPHQGSSDRDALARAFWALGQLLSEPSEAYSPPENEERKLPPDAYLWPFEKHGRPYEWRICRSMLPPHRDALHELFSLVRGALERAYAEGFESGRNLLAQLASGSITMDQFNDVSTREARSL